MADEPADATGSIPEGLAQDAPTDVDFTALMARSQAHLIHSAGLQYQSNADLEAKLRMFGHTPPAGDDPTEEP